MGKALLQTLCRLLAAFACLLCAGELFAISPIDAAPERESTLRADLAGADLDARSVPPDSREEREERTDDEDDDLDDWRHNAWMKFANPEPALAKRAFPRAVVRAAPRSSHLSLDPRPPRQA